MMKKLLLYLISASMMTLLCHGCNKTVTPSVSITEKSIDINVGETRLINVVVTPESLSETGLIWKSQNETIASVDLKGNVTGIAEGNTEIIVEVGDLSASCNVNVHYVHAEKINLDIVSKTIQIGCTFTIKAEVLPENATDKTLVWHSADESIASVDANGQVTAIALGETKISVTCGDIQAVCSVNVVETAVEGNHEGVTIDKW